MTGCVLTPELEELRREIAGDFSLHPERWAPPDPSTPRPGERFRERLDGVVRTLQYGSGADVGRALAAFVRYGRSTATVIPFPSRPRRPDPPPRDFPPAA